MTAKSIWEGMNFYQILTTIIIVISGVWAVAGITSDLRINVAVNTTEIKELQQQKDETNQRLIRIEDKIDKYILNSKKEAK